MSSGLAAANNPLQRLATDRAAAREHNDNGAALCMLATVNEQGDAEQRTLVLRDLQGRLALFFSATSPKWRQLQNRPTCSIACWLPSIQVQYRIRADWERINAADVRSSWLLRPDIPKKLDWLYQEHPQSTAINRSQLVEQLGDKVPTPPSAPDTAIGIFLNPLAVERLELADGVHQRERFSRDESGAWTREHLVP